MSGTNRGPQGSLCQAGTGCPGLLGHPMWPGHLALTHILSSQALGDYNPLFTPYPGHPLLLWPTGCGQKEDTSPPDHSTRRPPLYHRIMHEASITHTTGWGRPTSWQARPGHRMQHNRPAEEPKAPEDSAGERNKLWLQLPGFSH